MQQSKTTISKSTQLWKRHKLLWITTGLVIVVAVLLTLLPLLVKIIIRDTLVELGAQNVTIDDVDFNLFSSELVVKKTHYQITDFKPFDCKKAVVNIDLLPIFFKRIYIYSLSIDGCELDIQRPDEKTLLLNGLTLIRQHSSQSADTATSNKQPSPWLFGLHYFNIADLNINYKDKKITSDFYIKQLKISDVVQWQPELSSTFSLAIEINNKSFALNGTIQPFVPEHRFTGKLSLNQLDFKPFAALATTESSILIDGSLTTELEITSELQDSKYVLDIGGFVHSDNFNSRILGSEVSYSKLLWNGKLHFSIGKLDYSTTVFTDNDITISNLLYTLPSKQLNINSDTILFKGQFSHDPTSQNNKTLHAGGDLDIKNLSVLNIANNITIAQIGNIDAANLDIADDKYFFPTLEVRETRLIGKPDATDITTSKPTRSDYMVQLARLGVTDLQIADNRSFAAKAITLNDLKGQLSIDKQGKLKYLHELQNQPGDTETSSPQANTGVQKPTLESNKLNRELTFKVGIFETQGKNQFVFRDLSRAPSFQINLRDILLKLVSIDSSNPDNRTRIDFSSHIDEAATASFTGESQLFSKQLNTDINGKIRDLDLHTLTSYSLPVTGRKIRQGRLNADIKISIANRVLDNELDFTISKLIVIKDDDKTAHQYDSAMPLPMETAIDLLKDDKDTIKISVPVKGELDNPDFQYMPAVNLAIRKTLQQAALSYLKYTLQPWGTLISVGQLIAGKMSKIEFEPVEFTAGQSELSADQQQYLEKMATLLQKKPSMSIAVCGVATAQDKKALQPHSISSGKTSPTVSANEPDVGIHVQLMQLAEKRATIVKDFFVQNLQISKVQLRNCSPIYKDDEDGRPIVELLF